ARVCMEAAVGPARVLPICYPVQRTGAQRLPSRHIYRGVRPGWIEGTIFGALNVHVPHSILLNRPRRNEIADAWWILQNGHALVFERERCAVTGGRYIDPLVLHHA